jgi:hypothetical protein
MRSFLALGMLITLCASASAATVHHSRTHHSAPQANPPQTCPEMTEVAFWPFSTAADNWLDVGCQG